MPQKKTEQVYRWLLSYIDENKFSNSQRMPSENALRNRLSVSRETVRAAYERLVQEGVVTRVKGSGTFFNREVALYRQWNAGSAPQRIGLILQGQDTDANASLIEGIRSVLPEGQVDLSVFLTDNKFANERRCLQTVVHQAFSGFIVDGVKASLLNPNLDCYRELVRRQIPVVFYNNYYKDLPYPRVVVDDRQCADELMDLLIAAGHRHIAGIFVYDNYQSIEKFQGMTSALQRHGIEYQDDYIQWCVSNEAHDERFVRTIERFLKSVPSCTAVVSCNAIIYRLVRKALEQLDRKVPEDCSLVCFDYSAGDWQSEGITCSVYQGYEMGRQVACRLLRMISRRDCEDHGYSLVMKPKIFTGRSIQAL